MTERRHQYWAASAAVRAQDTGPEFFDVVDDHPGSDFAGFYRGFSTSYRLRAGRGTWFHIPLPTPTMIADRATALTGVTLLWDVDDHARIAWVTLHIGGATRIELSPRATSIRGSVETEFDTSHGLKIRMLRTEFGLERPVPVTMSVQLCVQAEAGEAPGVIRFYGAGAAFVESAQQGDR